MHNHVKPAWLKLTVPNLLRKAQIELRTHALSEATVMRAVWQKTRSIFEQRRATPDVKFFMQVFSFFLLFSSFFYGSSKSLSNGDMSVSVIMTLSMTSVYSAAFWQLLSKRSATAPKNPYIQTHEMHKMKCPWITLNATPSVHVHFKSLTWKES